MRASSATQVPERGGKGSVYVVVGGGRSGGLVVRRGALKRLLVQCLPAHVHATSKVVFWMMPAPMCRKLSPLLLVFLHGLTIDGLVAKACCSAVLVHGHVRTNNRYVFPSDVRVQAHMQM